MSPVSGGDGGGGGEESNSNLNANALEFVPSKESLSSEQQQHHHHPTGSIPKKFYSNNNGGGSGGSRREKFYNSSNNQRWKPSPSGSRNNYREARPRRPDADSEMEEESGPSHHRGATDDRNKKFFLDNYNNHRNMSKTPVGGGGARDPPPLTETLRHAAPRQRANNNYPASGERSKNRSRNNQFNSRNGIRSNNGASSETKDCPEDIAREANERDDVSRPSSNRSSKKPNNNRKKNSPPTASSASQRDRLIKEIENHTLECMICCERIKAYQSVWCCSNCFHILHLNCIKTWMKNSKTDEGEWRCPACNQLTKIKPGDYVCFCGKEKNPAFNRNELAHSCGDMCLSTQNCPHPCSLKCHPGPHEACHASVMKKCGCGKTAVAYQCSMKATFECEAICDRVLNCTVHNCAKTCHQGECEECTQSIACSCFCGAESKSLPCTTENQNQLKYSCEKECGKLLSCSNHTCKLKCHEGECGKCMLLPEFVLSCPCTKTPVREGVRTSCTDPIPVCENVCKKALRCGKLSSPHTCQSKCHLGNCPCCQQTTSVKCRCGRMEQKILCKDLTNTDLRCKKKCQKFKSCGRHKCNSECCIDINHTCTQNCNRLLECKLHKCQRICHVGNCAPCHRVSFEELRCECGITVIFPPVQCNTKITDCPRKCSRKHNCSHPIGHNCHSEPECPPCCFLTSKFCYGKHEERKTIPCNQDGFSCGMSCKKMLKCGRHTCIKTCHQGECEKSGEVCKQRCTVKRECEHNCSASCHDGECPTNLSCREKVQVSCICGNLKEFKTCEQVEYENRKLQRVQINLQMQQQQSDGITDLKTMLGGFKKTTKILECNDECKTLERNRRLDIAFKVQNPSLASTPRFMPTYSEHVRNFFKKDPAFVNMIHEKLTELVKLAKESKAPYRCHSFPSMNRDKRHVIHDIAELFGVETKAYDAEPNRNIVATATREYCWLPSMSVAEVAGREQGARRPPSNQIFK